MNLRIVVASGKGGTGKTFFSTNIARALGLSGVKVRYLDCDVEEPNGHLFLKPVINQGADVTLTAPAGVDETTCTSCGKCAAACRYHALALVKKTVLFFGNLCHGCGACSLVCPENAIVLQPRKIGELKTGTAGGIDVCYGLLETGEGGMTPRLIRAVKERRGDGVTIIDAPPGASCPVVETVKDSDLCVLVTDPTPFGVNDLKLAVLLCRELGREPVIIVNRADYLNNALKEYCTAERLEIVGEIPDDRRIAECYSVGDLVVDHFPEYGDLFRKLARQLIDRAGNKRVPSPYREPSASSGATDTGAAENITCQAGSGAGESGQAASGGEGSDRVKEVVVISGKGGTGKTSLAACFAVLGKQIAIADCDVDAADLHLVLKPRLVEKGLFSGGEKALIDPCTCTDCGVCARACRFNAIRRLSADGRFCYQVDEKSCEGCGVCGIVCPVEAVSFHPAVNGEWYVSETGCGPLSHARLGIAEENSGKLVSLIRTRKNSLAAEQGLERSLSDGSPGTGCPVIASLTGTDYAVVVTEPTVSGVHDLKRILDVIRIFTLRSGVVVNKHDLNRKKTEEIRAVAAEYGSHFLGTVPYDKAVTKAQLEGVAVVEYDAGSPSAPAITAIWARVTMNITGENNAV